MYHYPGAKEYIHQGGFKKDVPLLQDVVVVEGAGHFINQEKASTSSSVRSSSTRIMLAAWSGFACN
jgi:hypothetical protein